MTAKIDGTNGLLQSYDYQTPSTGFSYTFAAGTQMLFMVPASTLATGTITMPSAPADGMTITFSSSQQITALTVQGNTGQSISSAVTYFPAQSAMSYVYRQANATWYPCESVPGTGTQLVLGTSQTTTSGTSKDFTGIPSWVKRITLMCNGVSTNGSSALLVQLGAGSITTTGYNSMAFTNATLGTSTTGLLLVQAVNSGLSQYGSYTITTPGSNVWILQGVGYQSASFGAPAAGQIALGGTLDRLRFTTVNGTDAFDAGSVNIMYE